MARVRCLREAVRTSFKTYNEGQCAINANDVVGHGSLNESEYASDVSETELTPPVPLIVIRMLPVR